MKKRNIFIILSVLIILLLVTAGIITNYIDTARVTTNNEPKFCIKIISDNERKVTYWGLGYKVIRYVGVSPNEPFKNNIGVKMGSYFMKYELPNDNKKIKSLDDFYNTTLTKNKDIRNLSQQYNSFDAQKDNCFVIGAMVHNDYLYNEFMDNYKNKKNAFIRIAQNTVEGDLVLYDIMYNEKSKQLLLVTDLTRDRFSNEEDRKIQLKEYEDITKYQYNNHLYWVMYNGQLDDEMLKNNNAFVITTIN